MPFARFRNEGAGSRVYEIRRVHLVLPGTTQTLEVYFSMEKYNRNPENDTNTGNIIPYQT
jgi:hypothetical protein